LVKRLTADQIREIIELSKAGTPISRISKSNKIGKTTVYYHVQAYCRKMSKIDLDLLDDSEKGYIIGLFLGDGSFNRGRKTPRYVVRFALDAKRDQDVARRLVQIFQKARKTASVFRRDNTLIVKVCSKELVKYIQTYVYYTTSGNKKEPRLERGLSSVFEYGVLAGDHR
jgi:DNA-binding transcriptional regulator WhiA